MKDLYTFDKDEESALNTYNQVKPLFVCKKNRVFTIYPLAPSKQIAKIANC